MTRVAVLGAGSWGTAFSLVLADAGHSVRLWVRRRELCDAIEHMRQNPDYLPDAVIPETVQATTDAVVALQDAEVVVLAVPAQALRENLQRWQHLPSAEAPVVSLVKGVEAGTTQRVSQVIAEVWGIGAERIAVLSGPNLSKEIAQRQPAASVIACADEQIAVRLQRLFHTPAFRPYTSTDVIGCELGGATKNVIALAVGMAVGLGFGDNARATVITRGLAETARLGAALGADPYTFAGLAGLGDLVATCSSRLSRNRRFGEELGRGRAVEEIVRESRQVAEGVASCRPIRDLAERSGIEMPIVSAVAELLEGGTTPQEMLARLNSRSPKPERY